MGTKHLVVSLLLPAVLLALAAGEKNTDAVEGKRKSFTTLPKSFNQLKCGSLACAEEQQQLQRSRRSSVRDYGSHFSIENYTPPQLLKPTLLQAQNEEHPSSKTIIDNLAQAIQQQYQKNLQTQADQQVGDGRPSPQYKQPLSPLLPKPIPEWPSPSPHSPPEVDAYNPSHEGGYDPTPQGVGVGSVDHVPISIEELQHQQGQDGGGLEIADVTRGSGSSSSIEYHYQYTPPAPFEVPQQIAEQRLVQSEQPQFPDVEHRQALIPLNNNAQAQEQPPYNYNPTLQSPSSSSVGGGEISRVDNLAAPDYNQDNLGWGWDNDYNKYPLLASQKKEELVSAFVADVIWKVISSYIFVFIANAAISLAGKYFGLSDSYLETKVVLGKDARHPFEHYGSGGGKGEQQQVASAGPPPGGLPANGWGWGKKPEETHYLGNPMYHPASALYHHPTYQYFPKGKKYTLLGYDQYHAVKYAKKYSKKYAKHAGKYGLRPKPILPYIPAHNYGNEAIGWGRDDPAPGGGDDDSSDERRKTKRRSSEEGEGQQLVVGKGEVDESESSEEAPPPPEEGAENSAGDVAEEPRNTGEESAVAVTNDESSNSSSSSSLSSVAISEPTSTPSSTANVSIEQSTSEDASTAVVTS